MGGVGPTGDVGGGAVIGEGEIHFHAWVHVDPASLVAVT
jgi:hypothetical protein